MLKNAVSAVLIHATGTAFFYDSPIPKNETKQERIPKHEKNHHIHSWILYGIGLLGFYERFVDSLDDLISGTKEKRIAALRYLIKLGIGWGIGFLSAVLVLANVFESHIYLISSLFMGFIIFAIPVVILEEKQCLKEQI